MESSDGIKTSFRFILGYFVGFLIFGFLIPLGIFNLAITDPLFSIENNSFLILRLVISILFLAPGLIFMIWSNLSLFKTGKGGPADAFGVTISPRTCKLVTNGPYRYSRNPMVFGALCFYSSIALYYFSVSSIILLLLFFRLITVSIIKSEESRLLKDFGGEYNAYLIKTPRFFPDLRQLLK